MPYDIFVSYGWAKFTALAAEVADALKGHGHTVWLDREQIAEQLTDGALTAKIKQGLADSRYVAFFEAEARLAAQVGGDPVHVPRWQEKELAWADKQRLLVLYHSMEPPRIIAGKSSVRHEYTSIQEAAIVIHDAITNPDKYFRSDGGGGASASVAAAPSPPACYVQPAPPPKYMRAGGTS